MAKPTTNISTLIATTCIFLFMLVGGLYLPEGVNFLSRFSPWLAVGFGALFVMTVFLVFWLRGRYKRAHER